ncbi:Arsenate reductase [Jannaschia seosinensis]|uniref:Arsenate reductase n=1 Tax=Jannaschia seosinensis TaxID=313367 RepID=A0A0M7B9D0_9RHOB|nr:arsenate reductase (glutaredoxin) [Jannaschia seosinensis]CUH23583.1 Arsenate reductase [Jannaschia seosinensis]
MVTIYHNPDCSQSRDALSMIRQTGIEPEVILYLETPPSRPELESLIAAMRIGPRDLLRRKETLYVTLGLDDPDMPDERIIDAMAEHPVLIERPIVATPKGTKLCRPPEEVLTLLDTDVAAFTKESGETVHR